MNRRHLTLAAPLVLAMALGACGRSGNKADQLASSYCPNPFVVEDAQSLTRFKPGPGRDPRDIAFQANLTGTGVACSARAGKLEIELKVRIAVSAGPAVTPGTNSVPYFVRVLNGSGGVTQGQDFNADFRLSPANPRGASVEEITLTLFYNQPSDLGTFRVAVGLKPTPEELEYNRRAAAR
ncbi:MAG: hypothetical protein JSR47_15875 [Proteobacteria bacterium]|nr:hypothetical protein [Pseudomonadota bacterium]MBS0546586.1 hypothetical protein [Pseudomonadota bacterium]